MKTVVFPHNALRGVIAAALLKARVDRLAAELGRPGP
jgi:hypothetical protein